MSLLSTPALRQEGWHETLLVQTLEQAINPVLIIDERNQVILFNAAAETLWGRPRSQVLGYSASLLMPQATAPESGQDARGRPPTDFLLGVGSSREVSIERPGGERLWASMSVSRVMLAERVFHAAFLKDITAQRALQEHMRQLSLAADSSGTAIIVTGTDLRIAYVNQGFPRLLGYGPAQAVGRFPVDLLAGPNTDGQALETVREHAAAGRELHIQILVYASNGRPLWVSLTMNPVRNAAGELEHTVGVLTEITHTKMHEVLQHKVLDAMARDVPMRDIALLLCHEVEHIAPEVVTSLRELDPQGRLRTLAAPGLPQPLQTMTDGLAMGPQATSCGAAIWSGRAHLARDIATDACWSTYGSAFADQGLRACWSSPIKAGSGVMLGSFALYYRDASEPSALHERLVEVVLHLCALLLERERERAHIHQLAHYDALTGLANRRMLLTQAQRLLHDMQRTHSCLALVFIDLDRFKHVNDTWGHAAGDSLLRTLANRLRDVSRDIDVVARLGGDEFVVVLPQCQPYQAALTAHRLLVAISRPVPLEDAVVLQPRASIGIAMYPEDGADAEQLLRYADLAMYQAKTQAGRGYCFYRAQMNALVQERTRLEADLRVALREGGLQLHYQPQVSHLLPGQPLHGVEALLRWQHPSLGPIAPTRFVALAEESGLMESLSMWVLQEACRQLACWRREAVAVPHVCINLSASNLRNGQMPLQIASALRSHGLLPGDLQVEVTETTMLDPHPMTMATAWALHDHGVLLSLDDFGTGYSSLAALHSLPISMLKLDKSFIKDMGRKAPARALISAVLRIGESLGLGVVAEGVETDGQRALLQELGCPVLQGYLFARPMPAQQLQAWIAERDRPLA